MIEKKFSIPAVVLSVIAVAAALIGIYVEAIAAAAAALIITFLKRKTHLAKIPVVFSVSAILMAAVVIVCRIMLFYQDAMVTVSWYWGDNVLFSIMGGSNLS